MNRYLVVEDTELRIVGSIVAGSQISAQRKVNQRTVPPLTNGRLTCHATDERSLAVAKRLRAERA